MTGSAEPDLGAGLTAVPQVVVSHVQAEQVWYCSFDGLNYVTGRCYQGGTHRRVTVTTTTVVTDGWTAVCRDLDAEMAALVGDPSVYDHGWGLRSESEKRVAIEQARAARHT